MTGDEVRLPGSPRRGHLAAGWAVAFACLHFFWALGGDVGLEVSAGEELARDRPTWFVIGGLWGVGLLCLVGALMALGLTRRGAEGPGWRLLRLLGAGVALLLLGRGVAVEALIITGASGVDDSVSTAQKAWTLALWNPWFILGGVLFGLAARDFGKDTTSMSEKKESSVPR